MAKGVSRQGNKLVLRDANGKIVSAAARPARQSPETWRRFLLRVTDNGQLIYERLVDLALGKPFRIEKPDGSVVAETPTFEVQRAAAMNLLEMMHGKAVAQTEVVKAEKEAVKDAQLRSMSTAQLTDIVRAHYTELREIQSLSPGESTHVDGVGNSARESEGSDQ